MKSLCIALATLSIALFLTKPAPAAELELIQTIDLKGNHWDGAGLNVETQNGGIRLALPANYSAELETGTTNGRVVIDFPVTVQGSIGRHFTTTLGAGGAKLRAITTNGGVRIHQVP